jgi:ADP-heptose:LPS heptosyltransferase
MAEINTSTGAPHLFVLGKDYHLGDLLWFTAVLAEYRKQKLPAALIVCVPDRQISRILERNPVIDQLRYGDGSRQLSAARNQFGESLVVQDLRFWPIAVSMVRAWRNRLPWLYYRDLWFRQRGQWLATFLGLGALRDFRPTLHLVDRDRHEADLLPDRYVILAPHVGRYSIPLAGAVWRRVKGWPAERWSGLAEEIRARGYDPFTLAARGQAAIPGTRGLIGLPIRQVAGVIEKASALVTVESGLWFIAAATGTPFVIARWWLPRSVDWAGPMQVPHALVYRNEGSVQRVTRLLDQVIEKNGR